MHSLVRTRIVGVTRGGLLRVVLAVFAAALIGPGAALAAPRFNLFAGLEGHGQGAGGPAQRSQFVVRALGDSWTAGFGYCGVNDPACGAHGHEMGYFGLDACRSASYADACSSNHDFPGVANHVSWTSQWALRNGLFNFENYAVTGSTPAQWDAGRGDLHRIVAADPDLTLMTLGGNPVLGALATVDGGLRIVFGTDEIVRAHVEHLLAQAGTKAHLESVYRKLLAAPNNHVLVLLYARVIPSPVAAAGAAARHRLGVAIDTINNTVQAAVTAVRHQPGDHWRILAARIDHDPWPDRHQCPASQFWAGAVPRGDPWIISNDWCAHPTIAGYGVMADTVGRLVTLPSFSG